MTDDEFKKHLYKRLEEDRKNHGVLTTQIYAKQKPKKPNKYNHEKTNPKNTN